MKKLVIYDKIHYTKLVQKCEGSTNESNNERCRKIAGVGVGTVSRVLNNGSVKASTREKVEAAMTELNYQPDFYARGLKMKHTNTVALILPTVWHPFLANLPTM
nr:LacI family DNA-binding transcriptional regulator [Enterococcus faecium]